MAEIIEARTKEQLEQVRNLFREYQAQLGVDHCLAQLDREIESLPGRYALPEGSLLLALVSGQPAGCVGLRPFPLAGACEMKRLYVRPTFRGDKLGVQLIERVISEARARDYKLLRLDTHPPSMAAAVALYERFGFVPVASPEDAVPGLVYMQLEL